MAGIFRVGIILALVVVFMLPAQSEAFNRELSKSMVQDAIAFCPDGLRDYLEKRQKLVMDGMKYGELNPEAIDPMTASRVSDMLSKRISQGRQNDVNAITAFGTMAYFLSETISPGICRTVHPLLPEVVIYDGPDPVDDTLSRIKSLVEESRPFHGACEPETVGQAYSVAVNTIIDFWVSAYTKGGLNPGIAMEAGSQIDHSQKAIYTAEEIAALNAAEKAEAERLAELMESDEKDATAEETKKLKKEEKDKKAIEDAISKYNSNISRLEEQINSLHRKGLMNSSEREQMNDLKSRASEMRSRLRAFENDPKAALKTEKNNSW